MYAYVAYRIGDGPDAEDVTSDVFERALRYRASYDPRKGTPLAWLIGIARRSLQSKPPRLAPSEEADRAAAGTSLEDEVIRRLTIATALARLSERDRELLALRFGAGLKAAEIAEILGARTNTIEVALHRAVERARKEVRIESPPRQRLSMPRTAETK